MMQGRQGPWEIGGDFTLIFGPFGHAYKMSAKSRRAMRAIKIVFYILIGLSVLACIGGMVSLRMLLPLPLVFVVALFASRKIVLVVNADPCIHVPFAERTNDLLLSLILVLGVCYLTYHLLFGEQTQSDALLGIGLSVMGVWLPRMLHLKPGGSYIGVDSANQR